MGKRTQAQAEVELVQLKNCLVNLPRALVDVLLNAQTVGIEIPEKSCFAHPSS
jgi:hypothetical protein